jgi:hypothetical protein
MVAYAPPPPAKVKETEQPIIIGQPSGFEEEAPIIVEQPQPPVITKPSLYQPLLLDGSADFSNGQNRVLSNVANTLAENPALTVVVSVYTNRHGAVPERLYRAIQYAEQAADVLQRQGVSPKSIFMRALDGSGKGTQQPFVMEFSFTRPTGSTVRGALPVLGENFQSEIPGMTTGKGLFYKIQISSVTKILNRPILSEAPYPMIEKMPDFAYYRYTLGAFERFEDAKSFAREMQRKGQKGAYVVPFIHGKRVDKNEAKSNVGSFPDLSNYLRG